MEMSHFSALMSFHQISALPFLRAEQTMRFSSSKIQSFSSLLSQKPENDAQFSIFMSKFLSRAFGYEVEALVLACGGATLCSCLRFGGDDGEREVRDKEDREPNAEAIHIL